MNNNLTKIAIVGPESTGKSTLATYIASQLQTVCVPEYARYYCKNLQRSYTLQDEVNMFYGQLALEEALSPLAQHKLLICDTTIMTVKIWCDHLFSSTPTEVVQEIKQHPYDLYLLMDIDLPWEDDPLRDFPTERAHFLEVWIKELTAIGANFQLIAGHQQARLDLGLTSVQKFLAHQQARKV